MNILLMPATQMLAMTEGAGGLFDFNATLPLMAIQFILLTVILTFIFYKPVSKVIDEREAYINGNLTTASEKLIKADVFNRVRFSKQAWSRLKKYILGQKTDSSSKTTSIVLFPGLNLQIQVRIL